MSDLQFDLAEWLTQNKPELDKIFEGIFDMTGFKTLLPDLYDNIRKSAYRSFIRERAASQFNLNPEQILLHLGDKDIIMILEQLEKK